jgi:NAD(P)H dehydrogenase (quinone)
MTKILVTGATGNIGRKTLLQLLKRRPAGDLIGLARDPAKAADLDAMGIGIREGDYLDPDGLLRAFDGVEKVMLVSATAFTDRNTQHANVIRAAVAAGVRHLVFMPIIQKAGSDFVLPQVTEEDNFARTAIIASGLDYTFVSHPPFLESIDFLLGGTALTTGLQIPPGDGKAGFASQDELAEAHSVVLTEDGHSNRAYAFNGDPAVSFNDIAQIFRNISGKPVPVRIGSEEVYIAHLVAAGLPEPAAIFALGWVRGITSDQWGDTTGDLEKLLGRKPTGAAEFLQAQYTARQS